MALKITNNAVSRLAAAIADNVTSIPLMPGDGSKFPVLAAGDWHPLNVIKADGTTEIMKVTARAGDLLTVLRAQENTAAIAFNANDRVELRWTAAAIADVYTNIDAAKTAAADANTNANGRVSKAGDSMQGALVMESSIHLRSGMAADATAPIIYNDAGTRNVVFRTGPSTGYKFSSIDATGRITAAGDIFSSGRVYATSNGFVETNGNLYGTAFGSQFITDWLYNTAEVRRARFLRINGAGADGSWNWNALGGQPTYLWGSNDGSNMYLWNPSNFSVNYANSCNYANSAGSAGSVAGVSNPAQAGARVQWDSGVVEIGPVGSYTGGNGWVQAPYVVVGMRSCGGSSTANCIFFEVTVLRNQ